MEKLVKQFMALCAICILTIFMSGCQSEETPDASRQDNSIPSFGTLHNEIISEIFENLPQIGTRGTKMSTREFQSLCIKQAAKSAVDRDHSLSLTSTEETIAAISMKSVETIQSAMGSYESQIINTVVDMINNGESDSAITEFINSSSLDTAKTQAALNFYDTYKSSTSYWAAHGKETVDYIQTNVELGNNTRAWYDRISWGHVAFADAYYGWHGLAQSGCNIYVGAGAAAAGSVFTILNQLYH